MLLTPPTSIIKIALLLGTVFILSCRDLKPGKEIKLAHGLDVTHPVHQAMEFMARRVAEKSNGRLTLHIYPNAQLGSERENIEMLQIGSLAMTKVSTSVMESFAPTFKVFSLPYMFTSKSAYFDILDGPIGKRLLTEGSNYWLRGLTYYDAGSRSFYTVNQQVKRPADLKGLKIRVQSSPTSISMVNALGGSATPISWAELYTALQQGVVDGAENNPPSFYLSRHYEVAKYYSLNEHTRVPDILLISTKVWGNLSEQEQAWLQEAANESAVEERQLWQAAEREALAAVKAAGVEVITPDKDLFADQVQPLYENYKDDPEVYHLIQQIQAAQKESRQHSPVNSDRQ